MTEVAGNVCKKKRTRKMQISKSTFKSHSQLFFFLLINQERFRLAYVNCVRYIDRDIQPLCPCGSNFEKKLIYATKTLWISEDITLKKWEFYLRLELDCYEIIFL